MSVELRESRARDHPEVLAVLPHYGEPEQTDGALRALLDGEPARLRIIVVDNRGNLDAARLPERCELVSPGQNLGYCAATNRGIAIADQRGIPFVLLLNDDVRAGAGAVTRLLDVLLADPSIAGAGPLLTTGDGRRIWAAGSYLRFGPNEVRHGGHGRPVEAAPHWPAEVDFLAGAFALYRTADLVALGGLDESYFMYLEDVDLGVRLRERGRRLVYVPWASAAHGGSLSSGGGASPLRKFLMGVNTPRFLRRCRSFPLWVSFALFDVLGVWPSLLLYGLRPRRLRAQLAKARGLLLGIAGYRAGVADVRRYVADAAE